MQSKKDGWVGVKKRREVPGHDLSIHNTAEPESQGSLWPPPPPAEAWRISCLSAHPTCLDGPLSDALPSAYLFQIITKPAVCANLSDTPAV